MAYAWPLRCLHHTGNRAVLHELRRVQIDERMCRNHPNDGELKRKGVNKMSWNNRLLAITMLAFLFILVMTIGLLRA